MEPTIDFAVLTALPVERDAVLKRVRHVTRLEQPGDPYVYYRGEMEIAGCAETYQVVVTSFLEAGNVEAGVETAAVLSRWKPRYVLMVGIAGGFTAKGVERGAVLVANFIHYYEPGKAKAGGEERRARQYPCDRILWAKARSYEAAEWKGEVDVPLPVGHENYIPKAHFGPLACGEKVVASMPMIEELLHECPQALGVAMEAAGVAVAVANVGLSFLEIRGVSDAADLTKDDAWHAYAANAAAAFTAGFLRSHPIWSDAEILRRGASAMAVKAPTLTILRAQSLRVIAPQEILQILPSDLRNREVETVALDFTDLMKGARHLSDVDAAVQRLADSKGPLLTALSRGDEREFLFHGLVHIPLATLAGFIFSDRQKVRLFDFHPAPASETWQWPGSGEDHPPLTVSGIPEGNAEGVDEIILRVSVSYATDVQQSRVAVPNAKIEIDLRIEKPERGIVRSEEQVRSYGRVFRSVLDSISERMPGCRRVHLFYAGPVSLAFHLGQQVSENIHPSLIVWNYRREEGYAWGIDLTRACREEECVIKPLVAP
jgi:nucleoside phosphorylase